MYNKYIFVSYILWIKLSWNVWNNKISSECVVSVACWAGDPYACFNFFLILVHSCTLKYPLNGALMERAGRGSFDGFLDHFVKGDSNIEVSFT
jgi:hypothetical protein